MFREPQAQPLHPLQVVLRMQSSQACYSTTGQLNTTAQANFAAVAGHGGVGIIEEVGRLVKRVKPGDQVILATTPNCGVCQNCLSNRGDLCAARLGNLRGAPASTRVRAADSVLDHAKHAIELEDVEARVSELERGTEAMKVGRRR